MATVRDTAKRAKSLGAKRITDQTRLFAETARVLGCDESEPAFEAKLKKIATAKPSAGKTDAKDR